jgi:hypothetical protein
MMNNNLLDVASGPCIWQHPNAVSLKNLTALNLKMRHVFFKEHFDM